MPYKDLSKKKEYDKKYYLAHQNEKTEISREYYKNHKEEILDKRKEYFSEYHHKYYNEHKQEILDKEKDNRRSNLDEVRKYEREKRRVWRENHPEENRLRENKYKNNLKDKIFQMYGNECIICHEKEKLFLEIDHVQNDGYTTKIKNGGKGTGSLYCDIAREYNPNKYQVLCTNCNRKKYMDYVNSKPCSEKALKLRRINEQLKNKFLEMYGTKCNCPGCNETRSEYLTLDHVNNDGAKRRNGQSNYKEYKKAIRIYRPDVYQVLCFNCNCGKRRNKGVCPHVSKTNR